MCAAMRGCSTFQSTHTHTHVTHAYILNTHIHPPIPPPPFSLALLKLLESVVLHREDKKKNSLPSF